jgi:hypothetical protein
MAMKYDISHLVKTRFAPSHLRNVRVKGWDNILREMRTWWGIGTETIIETSFYERLKNVPREKKPIEKW